MNPPKYRVRNARYSGFCEFISFGNALEFYRDGIKRGEPYEFIVLDVEGLVEYIKDLEQNQQPTQPTENNDTRPTPSIHRPV